MCSLQPRHFGRRLGRHVLPGHVDREPINGRADHRPSMAQGLRHAHGVRFRGPNVLGFKTALPIAAYLVLTGLLLTGDIALAIAVIRSSPRATGTGGPNSGNEGAKMVPTVAPTVVLSSAESGVKRLASAALRIAPTRTEESVEPRSPRGLENAKKLRGNRSFSRELTAC